MWSQLTEWKESRVRFVIATVIQTHGSTPQKLGAQMAVTLDHQRDTVGGGAFEAWVIEVARGMIQAEGTEKIYFEEVHLSHDLGMCCGGRMKVMFQRYDPPPRLWILGAGHIGSALAKLAEMADFQVTLVDDRPEWTDPSTFSDKIDVICDDPCLWVRSQALDHQLYVVVTTHSHVLDQELIGILAREELAYLGLIGSRAKWERFKSRLSTFEGELKLHQVRCPMGIQINAKEPMEIGVSVIAELIQKRNEASVPKQNSLSD